MYIYIIDFPKMRAFFCRICCKNRANAFALLYMDRFKKLIYNNVLM